MFSCITRTFAFRSHWHLQRFFLKCSSFPFTVRVNGFLQCRNQNFSVWIELLPHFILTPTLGLNKRKALSSFMLQLITEINDKWLGKWLLHRRSTTAFFRNLPPLFNINLCLPRLNFRTIKRKCSVPFIKYFSFIYVHKKNRITVNLIISLFFTLCILSRSSKQPMWNRPMYSISYNMLRSIILCALVTASTSCVYHYKHAECQCAQRTSKLTIFTI